MELPPDKPYELVAHVAEVQEGGEVTRAENPFRASDIFYKVKWRSGWRGGGDVIKWGCMVLKGLEYMASQSILGHGHFKK
jgi:hypothetical protein